MLDAYVGLGSFDYWSSRKVAFLPFLGDYRERGIRRILIAKEHGRINNPAAVTALIWIFFEEERFADVQRLCDELLARYPNARSVLWAAGEAAYRAGDWTRGIAYYERILASVRADSGQNNRYNELGCYHRLAEMHIKRGEREQALAFINDGLALPLSNDILARKKNDLVHLRLWFRELSADTMSR